MSEDNKALNQLQSTERDSDVTKMKSTLPFGLSIDSGDGTGRKQRMKVVLDGIVQALNSRMKTNFSSLPQLPLLIARLNRAHLESNPPPKSHFYPHPKSAVLLLLTHLSLWQDMLSKLRKTTLF